MICEKTGAATVPPKIGVGRSRTTMMDKVGFTVGAKPTNDAMYAPFT